jgi:hypothetical protein
MIKTIRQHKGRTLIAVLLLFCGLALGAVTGPLATAQTAGQCGPGETPSLQKPCYPPKDSISKEDPAIKGTGATGIIEDYINPLIRLMTAVVGVVIVLSVVVAGIQYSSAGGDPSGVAAAKKRITAAVIALIAYVFALGFLQWLVPGGLV